MNSMKPIAPLFLGIFVLLASVCDLHAEAARPAWLFRLQSWGANDAFDGDEKSLRQAMDFLVNDVGYDTASFEMEKSGGWEIRTGVLFERSDTGWAVGPSIGYIKGPESTVDIVARSPGNDGTAHYTDKTQFVRALVEVAKTVPLTDSIAFRLGGAAGIARGKIETTNGRNTGSFVTVVGLPPTFSGSHDWTGVTWEISPTFIFGHFEIGFSYASFPKMKENDDYNEFKWNPYGLILGVRF